MYKLNSKGTDRIWPLHSFNFDVFKVNEWNFALAYLGTLSWLYIYINFESSSFSTFPPSKMSIYVKMHAALKSEEFVAFIDTCLSMAQAITAVWQCSSSVFRTNTLLRTDGCSRIRPSRHSPHAVLHFLGYQQSSS